MHELIDSKCDTRGCTSRKNRTVSKLLVNSYSLFGFWAKWSNHSERNSPLWFIGCAIYRREKSHVCDVNACSLIRDDPSHETALRWACIRSTLSPRDFYAFRAQFLRIRGTHLPHASNEPLITQSVRALVVPRDSHFASSIELSFSPCAFRFIFFYANRLREGG